MLTGLLYVVMVASVTADKTVYGLLGGKVDLEPDAGFVTDTTKTITWRVGTNMAIQWDGDSTEYYRYFRERGHLNNLTGVMTITGLVFNDSNTYRLETDTKQGAPIQLLVLSAVPEPTIEKVFLKETKEYKLTCAGGTEQAGPVSYTWKSDNNNGLLSDKKDYTIKEDSSEMEMFTCEMKNPVSQRSSKPCSNPFLTSAEAGKSLNIPKGVTVFICLFTPLVLLVVFHRIKTGVCFYEKSSLPWEKDFWRKNNRQEPDATRSNSTTTTPPLNRKSDEEKPMTES